MESLFANLALLIITFSLCYGAYRLLTRPTRTERWVRDTSKRMAHRVGEKK